MKQNLWHKITKMTILLKWKLGFQIHFIVFLCVIFLFQPFPLSSKSKAAKFRSPAILFRTQHFSVSSIFFRDIPSQCKVNTSHIFPEFVLSPPSVKMFGDWFSTGKCCVLFRIYPCPSSFPVFPFFLLISIVLWPQMKERTIKAVQCFDRRINHIKNQNKCLKWNIGLSAVLTYS